MEDPNTLAIGTDDYTASTTINGQWFQYELRSIADLPDKTVVLSEAESIISTTNEQIQSCWAIEITSMLQDGQTTFSDTHIEENLLNTGYFHFISPFVYRLVHLSPDVKTAADAMTYLKDIFYEIEKKYNEN